MKKLLSISALVAATSFGISAKALQTQTITNQSNAPQQLTTTNKPNNNENKYNHQQNSGGINNYKDSLVEAYNNKSTTRR